jgi:hypothetical protein
MDASFFVCHGLLRFMRQVLLQKRPQYSTLINDMLTAPTSTAEKSPKETGRRIPAPARGLNRVGWPCRYESACGQGQPNGRADLGLRALRFVYADFLIRNR